MSAVRGCLVVVGLAFLGVGAADRDVRLVGAAKRADWSALRRLLAAKADVNAPHGDGSTALHWAAYWDHADSATLLIRAGADVNRANDVGATPLWLAAENGSDAVTEALLRAGANPNAALLSGETPLMTAARSGGVQVVRRLVASGADVNVRERHHGQTALMWAVAERHAAVVDVLLAHGADIRARTKVWTESVKTTLDASNPVYIIDVQQGGYTPLLFAARVGDLASARLLVAAGADVNDAAPYGTSATVVAAHGGHGDAAAYLLEQGADPNAAAAGYTALHAAILHKDATLVRALLVHGADPNAAVQRATPTRRDSIDFYLHPSYVGASPFWLAARFSAPDIMRLLAEHGADPRVGHHVSYWSGALAPVPNRPLLDEGTVTPLMAAAGMGGRSPLVAVTRLDRIAESAPLRASRREPDPVALEAATLEAVTIAAELGADVNASNANGDTALHALAARGYNTVVKFLVQNGARLDSRNKTGQTPLAAATGRRHETTVELLRQLGAPQ